MLRAILAGILGVALAVLVVAGLEALSHLVFPPPAAVTEAFANPQSVSREELAQIFETVPFGAKISVVLAWGMGAFAGSALALRIGAGPRWPGYLPPGFILAAAVMTMAVLPHPLWMAISAALAIPLAGLLAIRLFSGPPRKTGALPGTP